MKLKNLLLGAIVLSLFVSCASTPVQRSVVAPSSQFTFEIPPESFEILGTITTEAYVVANSSLISRQAKNAALNESAYYTEVLEGDTGYYGFIGESNTNMTVFEKAIALATYKLLEIARNNGADTVAYVTSSTKVDAVQNQNSKSRVTATVSGLAVRIKPSEGAVIEYPKPVVEKAPLQEAVVFEDSVSEPENAEAAVEAESNETEAEETDEPSQEPEPDIEVSGE